MRKIYIVELPNGKKIKFWFSGKMMEDLLKAYNIPYEIVDKDGDK